MLALGLFGLVPARAETTPGNTIPLNLDDFAQNVDRELKNKCVGYGFAIYQNGVMIRSGAGGMARVASDTPARKFEVETRVDIGSCTKFITALAVLQELERQPQVGLDSPIYPYLPKGWTIHPSIKTITFREILGHRSGLRDAEGANWTPGKINDDIKATLKQGVSDPAKAYNYENVNFAMCRILLPYLYNRPTMEKLEGDVLQHERGTAECFINLCRQYVFQPAGLGNKISATTWDKETRPETLFYDFGNPVEGGPNKDSTLVIGAGGWWLNARELAAVCSALDRGKILGSITLKKMQDSNLGFYKTAGKYGDYYWHNGQGPGKKTAHADLMLYPNGVQIALAINSANNKINDYGEAAYKGMLKKAFDDACQQSDLEVRSFEVTGAAAYQGDFLTIPFRLTIRNRGAGDTDSHFVNAVYEGERAVWTGMMNTLKPGESRTVEGTVKIADRRHVREGKRVPLRARADARIQAADTSVPDWAFVRESDESNNDSRVVMVSAPGGVGLPSGGFGAGAAPHRDR